MYGNCSMGIMKCSKGTAVIQYQKDPSCSSPSLGMERSMPKRSKTKWKRSVPITSDSYSRFFKGNKRYVETRAKGPSPISSYQQVASFENKVKGYTTKVMAKIGNIVWAWHGTSEKALTQISSTGLLAKCEPGVFRGWGGLFGRGVYTAPSASKAWGHSAKHHNPSKLYFLLRCQVALGKVYYPDGSGSMKHIVDGVNYHSVHAQRGPLMGSWTGSLNNDEYVVYNPEQVTVDQIFMYKVGDNRKVRGPGWLWGRTKVGRTIPSRLRSHHCKRDGTICANAIATMKGISNVMGCILPDLPGKRRDHPQFCKHFQKSLVLPGK